jgi:hypothetical protein
MDVNSIADQLHPRQTFFGINILRWREIFRVIETSSSNINLIGTFVVFIGERRSTVRAKAPPGSGLRLICVWLSLRELELRTFYYNPGYRLSSHGSPAVGTMTIRAHTNVGRRAETHLSTITATGNCIRFHVCH